MTDPDTVVTTVTITKPDPDAADRVLVDVVTEPADSADMFEVAHLLLEAAARMLRDLNEREVVDE